MKDAMGCDDVACAAEIGGALGAPYLVAGQLTRLGDQAVLSLRLMDTQAPAVLERATARGPASAEALATMMAAAVGDLFGVTIAVSGPTVVAAPAAPASADYSDYTALMNELARLGSNSEYSQLLTEVERAENQAIAAPPSVDLKELLVYYRAFACSMLKRDECVRATVRVYQKLWPQGMYASTMQAYIDQLDDTALQRDAQTDDVNRKLEDLRNAVKSGAMPALDGKEAGAAVLMGGRRYAEAAAVYSELVKAYKSKPTKAMELVGMLVMALENAGELAKARQVLEEARRRQPRLFRIQGLHHKLRSLPR
jgi:tetratricopeptide (TPR) repeat protein